MLTLTVNEWDRIRKQLREDYAWEPNVLVILEVMRRELGFTTRYHRQWDPEMVNYKEVVCLDFYDDTKETYFMLKYL